jgi:PBP1b-binding outer membrane lipoprotein LpoB
MKITSMAAACAILLAGCANTNYTVPLSTTDPPPPTAKADDHCMQDCLSDNSDPAFCHSRCAK